MSYYESAKGKRVTYARAIKELTRHGLPLDGEDRKEFDLFFKEHAVKGSGLCHTITATRLLHWLGY